MYNYYVTYITSDKILGCTDNFVTENKVPTLTDILNMIKYISESTKIAEKNIIILSYIQLGSDVVNDIETLYDWNVSDIPLWVKYIATDNNGFKYGYEFEPEK